jgi:chromate reductase
MKKIAVIVGSLRKESWSRKLAQTLIKLAPASLQLDIVEIGELPLYNQDFDDIGPVPAAWQTFREQMKKYDGVLFITPEYNRSVPAPLKNAIDVGSRPYGQSIWSGKAGAVINCSPGIMGGITANHHLRQTFVCLDIFCMQQPESYLGKIHEIFAADGNIASPDTQAFLQKFIQTYEKWVFKILGA